jgi:hypothetical protein
MTSEKVMTKQASQGSLGGRLPAMLLGVAAIVAMTAVAWACRASSAGGAGTAANAKAGNTAPGVEPSAATQAPADTVTTTLGPSGFTPNQVSHPAVAFNLKVRNQSGEHQVTLQLSDSNGKKVSGARLTDKVGEWSAPLDLAAGTYTLSEANHSNWTCAVTVTAQQ